MKISRKIKLASFMFFLVFSIGLTYALPSGGVYPPEFTKRNGFWYDSWGFNRNLHSGVDGYLPNLAYETLGSNKERAYEIGEMFEENYENKIERAEAILDYVQRWTDYGFDEDNVFDINGVSQIEWAWNADEMAHMFDENSNIVAIGDCEDMSFLCATIYMAANFDVALVDAPGHVALLIWLPEYDNANFYWDLSDDGRDFGWIWVEATGEVNPLGWTPPDFSEGDWCHFVLGFSEFNVNYSPRNPKEEDDVVVKLFVESAISTIEEVILDYRIEGYSNRVDMRDKREYYEGLIPRQSNGTMVSCKVYVTDGDGFTLEKNFEYVVGQDFVLPPFLIESGVFFLIIFIIFVLMIILN